MAYEPCSFDRKEYLDNAEEFEAQEFEDWEGEMSEFNYDIDDLACELGYTRYRLAKAEKALDILNNI